MSSRNSSESSASSSSSSCAPCRRLLQQVLERHESRPRSLLSSMLPLPADHSSRSSNNSHNNKSSTLNWRLSPSGDIQVQIPTEEATQRVNTQRRWSRLPQTTTTITTTNNNNDNEKNDNVKTSSSSTPLQRFTSAPPSMQATSSLEAAQRQQKQQQQKSVLLSPTNDKNDDNTNLATSSTTTLMSSLLPSSLSSSAAATATSTTSASSKSNAANTNTATTTTTEWMNVSCQVCPNTGPKGKARAFVNGPNPLDVVVCSNRLRHSNNNNDSDNDNNNNKAAALQEMEEILTHELVHVFDVRGRNLDLRQCENLAYSEVRAAREAECQRTSTALGLQRSCVHERALLATRNLFPATQARECVRRVFAAAYADVQPDATTTTTTAAMGNNNGSGATTTTNASSSSSWQATSQR